MAKVIYKDMPTTVRSLVKEKDGYHTIIINARLAYEEQIKCYIHEVKHIKRQDFFANDLQLIEMEAHGLI